MVHEESVLFATYLSSGHEGSVWVYYLGFTMKVYGLLSRVHEESEWSTIYGL